MNHVIMQNRRWGWLRGLPGGPGRRARHDLRPAVLALEDRRLLASFAVTNTNPSGSGSLAAAIASAGGNNQANTITFQGSIWNTPQTISLGGNALVLSDTGGMQTITGPAAGVTISGGGQGSVLRVYPGVTATVSGLTITDGAGTSRGSGVTMGGGVYDHAGTLTLTNCTITGNSANIGGGVYNNYGTLTLSNCTISDNSASTYYFQGYPSGGVGAGLDSLGTLTLTNCTITGNNSTSAAGAGVVNGYGTATLTNCTISGNSADVRGGLVNYAKAIVTDCTITGNQTNNAGGGVYNSGPATLTLTNCTISGNSSADYAGQGGVDNLGTATLTNTIVAGNTGPSSAPSDISGTVTGSHNLIGTGGSGGLANGVNGNIVLTSLTGLGLAPLGDYGGPTQTMALVHGSAAIGKGVAVSGEKTDQRGFPLDSPIDIGAFQFHSSYSQVVKTTGDSGAPAGEFDLRGAVDLANVLAGAQTITFDPTVFATAQTITLTQGRLVLSDTGGTQTIMGPQAGVTISGGGTSGVILVNAGVVATLAGLTITDGYSNGVGPLYNDSGGGVYNDGTVTLSNCSLSGDSAGGGGGMENFGMATLSNCTLSGDSANLGGGMENDGTAILTNCTLSGDFAKFGGGGVYNYGTATLTGCTVSGNQTSLNGGGVYNYGTATLTNTIVAGNTGPSSAPSDISGTVTGSHNLIGTGGSGGLINGQNGNIVLTSLTVLGLAPLAFYGGPTQTMALLPGSAAIGKGTAVSGVTTDQRGFSLDSPIDIGAFQTQPSTSELVVNSTADSSGDQPGKLDLRGAVDLADVLTGAQTITFDATVFAKAQTILLTAGPLELSHTGGVETITGSAAGVTISGGGTSGIFQVAASAAAALSGLTITDGSAVDGAGLDNLGTVTLTKCTIKGNSANAGGGVCNGGSGTATLTDCTVSGNTGSFGGGLYDRSGTVNLTDCTVSTNTAYTGSGMFNTSSGSLTVDGCTISGNTAYGNTGSGGGILNDGALSVSDSKFDANHSDVYFGGGLENYHGTVTLTDCTFASNTATDGGGVSNFGGSLTANGCTISGNSATSGGGVYSSGTATLTKCTISGNSATSVGGGVYNVGTASLTNCTTSKNSASFGGGVQNTGTATLTNCTLSGNSAFNGGGGVNNGGKGTATLTGCTFSGNSADFGGGVNIGANATATLTNCTISGNSAQTGGGMENFGTATLTNCTISGNSALIGGGVYNVGTGTATITDSTLNGNTAAQDGGSSSGGALFDLGKAALTNCTIAGNSASESGGGIEAQGTVTVTFSTFSGNQATYGGAIDNNFGRYTVTLEDTILAGDSASIGPEFCNSVTSAGHNLVAETDGSSGWVSSDLTGTAAQPLNALLAALGKYGGPTQTIALLPGSPAIGTGIAVSGVTTDQRGVTRPSTGVDIGAFQSQGFTLTPVSGSTPQSAAIDTAFAHALGVTVKAKDSLEPVAGGVIAFAAPSSGATATLSGATATIGSNGVASVNATANNTAGTYRVTASAAGAAAPASFTLTNPAAAGAAAPASFTIGTSQPGTLTVQSAAQTLPADPNGKTFGPTPAGTGTEFTAQALVNGHPVPRVISSSAGWRSPRPWMAQAMRPRPAQQSTKASVTTPSLMSTSP